MMGRKTLKEIREQLAAAKAGTPRPVAELDVVEELERVAEELEREAKERDIRDSVPKSGSPKPIVSS